MPLECPLRSAARESPDAPAIVAPDHTLTFRELDELVSAAANTLAGEGLRAGERVAVRLDNGWRLVVLILAGIRAGIVVGPLSTRLPEGAVRRLCTKIGARRLITDLPGAGEAGGPHDEHIRLRDDQPATIVFTSGSTGEPRGVLHTWGNHRWSAEGSNANIFVEPGDRWLLCLPLYHVGGLAIIFRCLLSRAAMLIPPPDMPLEEALHGATHASMVATQLQRVLTSLKLAAGPSSPPAPRPSSPPAPRPSSPPAPRSSSTTAGQTASEHFARLLYPQLKALLLGGGAVPKGLIIEAHECGLPIHTSYGLTEMASQVTTTPPGASLSALTTSGRVLPHREVRLAASGEIMVRGRTRFAGYIDGEFLARPFDEDGWYATRDVGYFDGSDYLHVVGRLDNQFVSGGEKVMPEEIESVLEQIEGVLRAIVVPVDDAEFGQRPAAFVDIREGGPSEDLLRKALEDVVPRFKIPIRFYPWPSELPSAGIKPDRAKLRQIASDRYAKG